MVYFQIMNVFTGECINIKIPANKLVEFMDSYKEQSLCFKISKFYGIEL